MRPPLDWNRRGDSIREFYVTVEQLASGAWAANVEWAGTTVGYPAIAATGATEREALGHAVKRAIGAIRGREAN